MSVGPRINFARFPDSDSPKLLPWNEHYRRVTQRIAGERASSSAITSDEDGAIVWQLLSANNRILGRSAAVFGLFDDAVADAREVITAGPGLEVVLVTEERAGMFGWYATSGADVAMTCSRWYVTERDRRQSIELALASIIIAVLGVGARPIHAEHSVGSRERV